MEDKILNKWIANHKYHEKREEMDQLKYDSWEKSINKGINPLVAKPQKVTENEFIQIKRQSKRTYIYSNSILSELERESTREQIGCVLFDADGCILKLYGNSEFKEWANEIGIEPRTIWNESTIGTNAFSLGIKSKSVIELTGEENFSKLLIKTACYFYPLKLENDLIYGGLMLVVPVEAKSSYLREAVVSIARSIDLQVLWFKLINQYGEMVDGYGVISLDQSNGENRILTISRSIFKMFDVKNEDYYYLRLEELIGIEPKNKEFWKIINNKIIVNDKRISIVVRKKELSINISTTKFKEEKFHMNGIAIAINSIQRINKLINQYTGNNAQYTFDNIIGKSDIYQKILERSRIAAASNGNVLLLGESGVGKDVIAQAIHNSSDRVNGPFIAINCASFSRELIGSELFGYEEGAFTGARKGGNIGKFELAKNGTLFLDEIGDMPLDIQATLLRVIEQKSFMRIGSNTLTKVDVRIIAATNNNLAEKIKNNLFREDLFYRLGVIRINIPPLRKRTEDILLLAYYFIERICKRINRQQAKLTPDAEARLLKYQWPGNVRELQNLMEGILSTTVEKNINADIITNYLSLDFWEMNDFQGELSEKERIIEALKINRNNKVKTAEYLEISRRTLYRRLEEYDLL
ncbi:sigma-54 interaction domain-containing protein [Acetobacterium malicum]|uniref:sigma-54 interaction domain-containing protein n=1 Tax=Acetobacterium malicum TaxID=52692 RepID=UPI00041F6D4E|nr:sigma 54-interacting transcriptional regulator [Acetobacterium dehalogenans]